jgi:gamma-glutamylcyclotransferase (GGCT)/AIG2-like uncharacterized protein YtfP
MESLVFVYGTLRRDARGQMLSPLCRDWAFAGYGTVPGELYDFGAYPGAVPSESSEALIKGEVYELPDPREMLPLIDRYEGCGDGDPEPHEFTRHLVDVQMNDGSVVRAWIYWYQPRPLGRRLGSGDYLERTGARPSRA